MTDRNHVYPVLKQSYTDFDMSREDVVSVSMTKSGAEMHAWSLNAKRTKEEIEREVAFVVGKPVRIV
jgi:hypothetical protein